MPYRIETLQDPNCIRVTLSGDNDVSCVEEFYQALLSIEERSKYDGAISLDEVNFIDASWMQVLWSWKKETQSSGRSFEVTGATEELRAQLDEVGMGSFLQSDLPLTTEC